MSTAIRNKIFNLVEGSSGGSYWTPQKIADTFLFYGETSKITEGKLYNQVKGSSDWLTVGGITGSETYQAPDNATYKTADTDYIWFNHDASQRTTTTAELIGYDLQRTPIKYMDDVPNTISIIGILKTGVTLTGSELDRLFALFQLPILWNDSLNTYGHIKSNRIGQNIWPVLGPELVVNGGAPGTTDWVDSTADGFADSWSNEDSNVTSIPTIVTGNGFVGNAQRMTRDVSVGSNGFYKSIPGVRNILVNYTISYRASKATNLQLCGLLINLPINIGDAVIASGSVTTGDANNFVEVFTDGAQIGDYLEVDNFSIKQHY